MCRMLLAFGNVELDSLLDSLILMAKDLNITHELNKEKGLGSWRHDDGWGIAYLNENENWVLRKSTKAIYEDKEINNLRGIKTSLAILHARKKMGSEASIDNTHPFIAEKRKGKTFIFCHNGFIDEEIPFNPKFKIKGKTDSEKLFYSILTDLRKNKFAKAIRKNFKKYKKLTGTNIILATRENSVVAIRENSFPRYYQMHLGEKEGFTIISSEILPNLSKINWQQPLEQGDIVTIKNKKHGIKVYDKNA